MLNNQQFQNGNKKYYNIMPIYFNIYLLNNSLNQHESSEKIKRNIMEES